MAHLAIAGGTALRQAPFPAWPVWDESDVQALRRVLQSGRWDALKGEEVSRFEAEFAAYQGAAHGVAVTNGTVALKLALIAAGVGPGDEVIVPGYTFIATATAALELGAIPIFADVDPHTYTLDPDSVAACVTPRTRAIMPVHLGGCPADMDGLLAVAQRHGLAVVEDAAQAWGASWNGSRVGTIGQCGIVSFHASKNLTAGEGGMVLCNDPDIACPGPLPEQLRPPARRPVVRALPAGRQLPPQRVPGRRPAQPVTALPRAVRAPPGQRRLPHRGAGRHRRYFSAFRRSPGHCQCLPRVFPEVRRRALWRHLKACWQEALHRRHAGRGHYRPARRVLVARLPSACYAG